MIKDILVNLPVEGSRDVVTSFAVSGAARFGAHLTGVAFLYEPLMPVMVDMYGAFTANASYKTAWLDDNLHPNDSGYVVMGQTWYAGIKSYLR